MKKVARFAFASLVILSSPALAQTLNIEHKPVGCVAAGKFPRFEAGFAPAGSIAAARVVFQGQTTDWYSVAMKPEGSLFAGVLPQPKKELKSFRYYIEVTDKAMGASRTPEYTAAVVDSAGACQGRLMASALSSASVVLQGPAGVAALPAGFASTGVVAGSASGAAAGAAGASSSGASGAASAGAVAGAGGGIGTTALVIGGVAVAGGAVAVGVSKAGGDDGSSDSGSGNSGSFYNVAFLPSPPGIDVSICAGRQLTWTGHTVGPDAQGNFNETWSPNEPNTVRITGQVTATNFQATIACTNGARSGPISATGSNGNYSGTFSFGPSSGQVSIVRR